MSSVEDQLEAIRRIYGKAALHTECGRTYVFIAGVTMPSGVEPSVVDLLLCPTGSSGYPSRLFFSQQLTSRTQRSWNGSERIAERQWYAISWTVPESPTLEFPSLVAAHLRAFA